MGCGSCGTSVGVGYDSTEDRREDFSDGVVETAEDTDGGTLGLNDGMAAGRLLMLC